MSGAASLSLASTYSRLAHRVPRWRRMCFLVHVYHHLHSAFCWALVYSAPDRTHSACQSAHKAPLFGKFSYTRPLPLTTPPPPCSSSLLPGVFNTRQNRASTTGGIPCFILRGLRDGRPPSPISVGEFCLRRVLLHPCQQSNYCCTWASWKP